VVPPSVFPPSMKQKQQQPKKKKSQSLARGFLTFLQVVTLCFTLLTSNPAASSASDSDAAHLTYGKRYWTIQMEGTAEEKIKANKALMDYAVGTVNTMFYDHTAGASFDPREFFHHYRQWLEDADQTDHKLASREGVVESLRWLARDVLPDPYAQYLTRDELRQELVSQNEGFLGLGALVEAPGSGANRLGPASSSMMVVGPASPKASTAAAPFRLNHRNHHHHHHSTSLLTTAQAQSLPIVTAVTPHSPAERAGLTVGDRIVAVGQDSFLHLSLRDVQDKLQTKYRAENYLGHADLTIAKPEYTAYPITTAVSPLSVVQTAETSTAGVVQPGEDLLPSYYRNVVTAFRPTRVRLATIAASPSIPNRAQQLVQYELLADESSIFRRRHQEQQQQQLPPSLQMAAAAVSLNPQELRVMNDNDDTSSFARSSPPPSAPVGYIRLTRFSRASTAAFFQAVEALEAAGVTDNYIIDLRNNYGGVIQEAMLTAAALLPDPHAVLCYTMNSRGGFTPHDVQEYVLDQRYPGYLLSRESKSVTLQQVKREYPELFAKNKNGDGGSLSRDNFSSLSYSSYASIHEQKVKHGLHLPSTTTRARKLWVSGGSGIIADSNAASSAAAWEELRHLAAQKNLVLLINEGTASSAEVFASALHDNGRTVALIGTRTFGKGLVQHTFPLPDGGGLRMTVAEYLTPALHHVTHVGGAQYDRVTGDWIGGGLQPDIVCDSRQGIPGRPGADLCVGVALDALEEADSTFRSSGMLMVERRGGVDGGSRVRRAVQMGVVRVSCCLFVSYDSFYHLLGIVCLTLVSSWLISLLRHLS